MKHYFTILFLLSFGALNAALGQVGNVKLLSAENFQIFSGDNSVLSFGDSIKYFYDGDNNLSEQISWAFQNGTWSQDQRFFEMTYDVNGNLLTQTHQKSNGGATWENNRRFTFIYDTAGNLISKKEESWNNNTWVANNMTLWTYDLNNNLLLEFRGNSQWVYEYDQAGKLVSKTYSLQLGSGWVNYNREIYDYLPWGDEKPTSYTWQHWSNNAWEDGWRVLHEYDGNGNRIIDTQQILEGGIWVNAYQYEYFYNTINLPIHVFAKKWIDDNWVILSQGLWEYDDDGDTRLVTTDALVNGLWVNQVYHKYYYTDFVDTPTPTSTGFDIFPNPATNTVTLQSEGLSHVMIFDTQGRLVGTQTLQGQGQEILQLGNLPVGNYHLQVLDRSGKTGAKPLQIRR